MTEVIGIGGKLQHGKDAIADYLVDELGWVKLGMSDALAEIMYTLDPYIVLKGYEYQNGLYKFLSKARLHKAAGYFYRVTYKRYSQMIDDVGYAKAKENLEVRRLLQVMGTEVGREIIDPQIWVKMMTKKVKALQKEGVPGVIVTGVRFPNESRAIKTLGGELWWVVRPLTAESTVAAHDSENSLAADDFDVVIENDGSLAQLHSKVDDLVD